MITDIAPINNCSTIASEIFLLINLPAIPPSIPPDTINASISKENSGTLPAASVDKRLDNCEKKIIYKEFSAAVLVDMEKKKNKTIRLMGPPPIPRKEERIPNIRPIIMQEKAFLT